MLAMWMLSRHIEMNSSRLHWKLLNNLVFWIRWKYFVHVLTMSYSKALKWG